MSTMLSRIAASGCVAALNVVMFSPDTAVGDQISCCVPIVQKNSTRLTRPGALCARFPSSSAASGDSARPAPAPLSNVLRLNLRIFVVLTDPRRAGRSGGRG